MFHRSIDIIEGIRKCVVELADVKVGQNVLVLTDTSIDPVISETFASAVKEVGGKPIILIMPSEFAEASMIGGDVPRHVVTASEGADIVISPTSYPMQHTPALRPLVGNTARPHKSGRKWINVPPPHMLSLSCDGAKIVPLSFIANITNRVVDKMKKGHTYRMITDSGTDITTDQDPKTLGGTQQFPLPPGCFRVFPCGVMNTNGYVHSSANGIMVVDAVDHFRGLLSSPVKYTIKDGYVEKVEGGFEAGWIWDQIQRIGREKAAPWWEFSIGMNPCIPTYKNNFEGLMAHWHAFAHRTAGAVHISIGIDPYFHLHGTILEPTVQCLETKEVIIEKGRLKVLDEPDIKDEMNQYGIVPSRW